MSAMMLETAETIYVTVIGVSVEASVNISVIRTVQFLNVGQGSLTYKNEQFLLRGHSDNT